MLPKEVRMKCLKCKGTGVSDKPLMTKPKNDEDEPQPILAPIYEKGERPRQQFQNCKECKGSGLTMQPPPTTIFKEGEKIVITPEEARQRYEVTG